MPNLSRRSFLRGNVSSPSTPTLRPPWAITEEDFIDKCTRCDDCIKICEENILLRGDGGYPTVDFKQGECTFCFDCLDACKTAALKVSQPERKPETAWNLDIRFNNKCLSLNAVVCRVCGENCEPQAINFKLKVGGISEPQIDLDNCTGCGACLTVCPVDAVIIKPLMLG